MVPRDQPRAADDAGTTAQEQRQGASLDERLTEEEEEGGEPGARPAAGRLREQGSGLTDQEKDEVADEAEDDTEGRSAEEAAVRLEDTPGGSTGGPDTYVQEDQGRSP